ncbi:unnamed protein product [Cuscuta europaea]|uniref:Uncharacterized protein n=1 Tax=Cuscuta europaea TaxID=41803 RepID=A0A9P0YJK8_CUSEU|nr:unnamed protein product [Cuscuta europaea]
MIDQFEQKKCGTNRYQNRVQDSTKLHRVCNYFVCKYIHSGDDGRIEHPLSATADDDGAGYQSAFRCSLSSRSGRGEKGNDSPRRQVRSARRERERYVQDQKQTPQSSRSPDLTRHCRQPHRYFPAKGERFNN